MQVDSTGRYFQAEIDAAFSDRYALLRAIARRHRSREEREREAVERADDVDRPLT